MKWKKLIDEKPDVVGKEYLIKFKYGGFTMGTWRQDSAVKGFGYEDGDYYNTVNENDDNVYWIDIYEHYFNTCVED